MPVLVALLALSRAGARSEGDRLPIPDAAARATALTDLRKEFADKLKSRDPEVRRALARALLERSLAYGDDPIRRFVCLDLAAALAQEVRDVGLSLDVVDRLAHGFDVPKAPRGVLALDAIVRGAKDVSVLAEAANASIELAGVALSDDDPATASRAIASATTLSKSAKLLGLAVRAGLLTEFVAAFRRVSASAAAARTTLATAPDDPAAHEAVGRFLCFGRGRFDEGLESLGKAGDKALAELAIRDRAHPDDPALRGAIVDGWWDAAQREKDPLAKARMLARAAVGYESEPKDGPSERAALARKRLESLTWRAFDRGIAFTRDFSKDGPTSVALATIRAAIARQRVDRSAKEWRTRLPRFPDVTFGRGEEYLWRLETNQGVITLRFFADTAPRHVANFLWLTELGYFDGLTFHRVVPDFMAQGGCPKGTGSGDPGYTFAGEFASDRRHDKAGIALDGEHGSARVGRIAVLHHLQTDARPGRQAHRLRRGDRRDGGRPQARGAGHARSRHSEDPARDRPRDGVGEVGAPGASRAPGRCPVPARALPRASDRQRVRRS